jgi:ubiquinone/menaquinone biosynthesis C-methylase UbiE
MNNQPMLDRDGFYKSIGLDRIAMREKILEVIPQKNKQILEVGTGKGTLTKVLAKNGFSITSVDICAAQQKEAQQTIIQNGLQHKVQFIIANAEQLPFKDNTFTTVVCAYTFHHLPEPFKAIKEMLRVCSKTMILVEFNQKGFAAVAKAHELEGNKHEENGIPFSEVPKQLQNKNIPIQYWTDDWQDIYLINKGA